MNMYSMPGYFQNMPTVGKALVNPNPENEQELKAVENDIHESIKQALDAGITTEEKLNARGQLSATQRINALIDPGTWCPLNSLYNPEDNRFQTTNVLNGLGRVNGKWVYIIASDNKKMAGAWVPGQADNLLRAADTAKMLHLPLVYLLNCSGVEFPNQDKVYPNRRGGGTPFFRNAELNQLGVPVIVGIYGTACEQQSDIRIEALYPPNGRPAPEDALQRTVCWEETMTENHEFSVEYSYVHTARYHDVSAIEPDAAQPCFDTGEEAPHIIFTPYLRALVQALTEGVDSLLERARIFYDFITLNMKYTFMPAYFILENIAEAAARSYTGDCGVFALLFVTLCRCAGIPAQWQSGLTAEPDFCGGHDWARFYIAPYGWLYADPSYGIAAVRARNETRRFYFGNLDAYRMVANNAFQAPFTVPKQHWRADPYDNQVGEIETAERGLGYGEFERSKEVLLCEELPL